MNTTIAISKDTREALQEYGKKSESYDDIILRILNEVKMQKVLTDFITGRGYCTIEEAIEWAKQKLKDQK